MAGRLERPNNVFPVTVAIIAGLTNLLLLAFARQYIEDDTVNMIVGIYAYLSVPLCAYGLVGIIKEKPKYIAVFANYLFLDAAVWALCRFLVAQFFFVSIFDDDVCSVYNPRWSPENFHHDIITSVQRFRNDRDGISSTRRQCQVQVGAFQTVLVFLLLAFTAAHGSIAMGMRQHAKEVEKQQQRPEIVYEREKPALEDLV